MKKIILAVSLLIFLISCNCVETHLTKEERKWFEPYEKGQVIIFKSNFGNLDSLVVSEKYETFGNKACNWLSIGTTQNNIINIVLKSKVCRNEIYCDCVISISKDKQDVESFPFIKVFGLEYAPAQYRNIMNRKGLQLKNNGLIYANAFFFDDNVNARSYGSNYLKSFYWDKKEGLVRYDTNEGEVFELISKN